MCAYVQPVFDMECASIPGGRGFKFIPKPLSPEIVEIPTLTHVETGDVGSLLLPEI
jgi:hypothetical protein